jgi:hypothetical protein
MRNPLRLLIWICLPSLHLAATEIAVHFHNSQQPVIKGHFLRIQDDRLTVATLQHGGTIERPFHTSAIKRIDPGEDFAQHPDLLWDQFFNYTRWLIPWFSEAQCSVMLEHWRYYHKYKSPLDGIIALKIFIEQLTHPDVRNRAVLIWLKESAAARQWESIIQFFENERLDCPWRIPEILWTYRIQAHWHLSQTEATLRCLVQWLAVHYPANTNSEKSPVKEITSIYNSIIGNWDRYHSAANIKPPQPIIP